MLFVNPSCIGTQVESVTDNAKVQCEIISMPSCSMPLCSPVKSVVQPDDDDKKDEDYIPPINLFRDEDLEEEMNVIEDRNQTNIPEVHLLAHLFLGASEF